MNLDWQSSWTLNSMMHMNIASLTIPLLTLFACFTLLVHAISSVPLACNHSTHTFSLNHLHWRVNLDQHMHDMLDAEIATHTITSKHRMLLNI